MDIRVARRKCIGSGFLGRKTEEHSMCVGDCIDTDRDRFTDYSSGKKGFPGLCNVLPSAFNVGVLCFTETRTVLTILVHCLMHCTTTRITFSEPPQALY